MTIIDNTPQNTTPHHEQAGESALVGGMKQPTLFDACGIHAPIDYFPAPTDAEAYQRLEVARILRDSCKRNHPEPVTFAQAQQEAGYKLPGNCSANAVQGPGANDAIRYGWVVAVGDTRPINKAAHGKKVNLYVLAERGGL